MSKKILLFIAVFLQIIITDAQRPFITEWTNLLSSLQISTSAGLLNLDVTPPVPFGYTYNYDVKYYKKQDSLNTVNFLYNQTGSATINTTAYTTTDTLVLEITGNFPHFFVTNNSYRNSIVNVKQWGDIQWKDCHGAFRGCENLNISATDIPDFSQVQDMERMFESSINFNNDLSSWDVSSIKSMRFMFANADAFNQDLSSWDVSSVERMDYMFSHCQSFNGNISNWNVSSCTSMSYMFSQSPAFNRDLSNWDVSSVTTMRHMFAFSAFNEDISTWDVSSVTDMESLFAFSDFNRDISNWDVSSVTTMQFTFSNTPFFNQDISNWDVSSVINMREMFWRASAFNQNLSTWDVSKVENMNWTFGDAISFNGDISTWNVSSVITMHRMFSGALLFDCDISNWNVSNVQTMEGLFGDAASFNRDLSNWSPLATTNMNGIFSGSGISYCNFNNIMISWSQKPLKPNLNLGGLGTTNPKYTNEGAAALATLRAAPYNWQVYVGFYFIPTMSINLPASVCLGDTIVGQGSSSLSSLTYMWPDSLYGAVHSFVAQNDTTIIVVGEDPLELKCYLYDTTSIVVHPLPNVTISNTNLSFCAQDTVTFIANGTSTYLWNNQSTTAATTYALLQDSIISVIGTDANGCKDYDSVSVQVHALPTVTIATAALSICDGDTAILQANGADLYQWNTAAQTNSIAVSPTTATSYSVIGTDINGCKGYDTLALVVNTLPTVTINSLEVTCIGNLGMFAASGAATYEWADFSTAQLTDFIIQNDTLLTLIGTDANGCVGYDTLAIIAHPLPTVTISNANLSFCAQDTVTFIANGTSAYLWNNQSTTAATTYALLQDSIISVIGTDVNGCKNYDSVSVQVHALPTVTIATAALSICYGDTAVLQANGADMYQWNTAAQTNSIAVSPTTATSYSVIGTDINGCKGYDTLALVVNTLPTVTINALEVTCVGNLGMFAASGAATYEWADFSTAHLTDFIIQYDTLLTLIGTDANGCVGYDTLAVIAHPLPNVSITTTELACKGAEVIFLASGATDYEWFDLTTTATYTITITNDIVLTVKGTDAMGCIAYDTIHVTALSLPLVMISADTTAICDGDEIILTGSGANSYFWSTNETTNQITVSPAVTTNYSLTGTASNGCENAATFLITVNNCIGLEEKNILFSVFPNPAVEYIFVETENIDFSNATILLIDITGKVLVENKMTSAQAYFSLANFSAGVYFVKIQSGKTTQVEKIVKY